MRIPSTAPPDIMQAFREVWASLEPWIGGKNVDLKGRRMINAGDAVNPGDYLTLGAAKALITGPLASISPTGNTGAGLVLYGLNATKVATAPQPNGALFIETDRGYAVYQAQNVSGAPAWVWVGGGPFRATIANITTGLGTNDAGYLFYTTDFDRVYRWSGSAWADAPGEEKRGQIVYFPVSLHADFAPGAGWALCDGTAGVSRTTPTGGTTTVTVPDLVSAGRFLRSVATTTGGTGGNAGAHTHSVDPPDTTSGVDNGAGATVVFGGVDPVAVHTHTHSVNIAPFTSGGPSGSGGDDALPPYYNARPYIRL